MKRVLIIDDSLFMSERLSSILKEMGKEVVGIAPNGAEGVALYKRLKPDFVFLDIYMPVLSGKDALVQIIDFDPDAFVVMCSTMGSENVIEECLEYGAQYYLLKPFIPDKVREVVTEVINKAAS